MIVVVVVLVDLSQSYLPQSYLSQSYLSQLSVCLQGLTTGCHCRTNQKGLPFPHTLGRVEQHIDWRCYGVRVYIYMCGTREREVREETEKRKEKRGVREGRSVYRAHKVGWEGVMVCVCRSRERIGGYWSIINCDITVIKLKKYLRGWMGLIDTMTFVRPLTRCPVVKHRHHFSWSLSTKVATTMPASSRRYGRSPSRWLRSDERQSNLTGRFDWARSDLTERFDWARWYMTGHLTGNLTGHRRLVWAYPRWGQALFVERATWLQGGTNNKVIEERVSGQITE